MPRVRQPVSSHPQIHQIDLPLPRTSSWQPTTTTVYLVEGDPLTLIDSGVRSDESSAVLGAALEALGYEVRDLERVVITHAHRDHFGAVQSLRDAGATLECCAHEADAPFIEDFERALDRRIAEMSSLFREHGVPESLLEAIHSERIGRVARDAAEASATRVDRRLVEGDRIEWKDFSLRVLHSPGHTPGHLLLEDEESSFLVTGDQIMGQAIPQTENFYVGDAPDPADAARRRPRFRGLVELRTSLRRLRGRPYRVLLPGFGGPVLRPDRTIRDTLLFYEVRVGRIARGLRHLAAMGQEVTAYEVWKADFPTAWVEENATPEPGRLHEMRSQMLLVIGALDCLEHDELLATERRTDGVLIHRHH